MVSRREHGYRQGKRRALCTRGCRVKGRFGMKEIVQRSAPERSNSIVHIVHEEGATAALLITRAHYGTELKPSAPSPVVGRSSSLRPRRRHSASISPPLSRGMILAILTYDTFST